MTRRATVSNPLSCGRYIHLGPFQIDQQRQEITRNGERLKLQGKVYQVLMALLEKPGGVVTREELRQRLWPAETHVNYDANVNTTVNKLRLALGDSSDEPIYIETIPRKGYCLLVHPKITSTPRPAVPQLAQRTGEPAQIQSTGEKSSTGHLDYCRCYRADSRGHAAWRRLDEGVDLSFRAYFTLVKTSIHSTPGLIFVSSAEPCNLAFARLVSCNFDSV